MYFGFELLCRPRFCALSFLFQHHIIFDWTMSTSTHFKFLGARNVYAKSYRKKRLKAYPRAKVSYVRRNSIIRCCFLGETVFGYAKKIVSYIFNVTFFCCLSFCILLNGLLI